MALSFRKSFSNSSVKSPSPSQQGNLTGPRRVVNDNIVTFYNSIQKWNESYLSGVQGLQDIQNDGDADSFQSACEKLGIVIESMIQQTSVMNECTKKLASLSQLQCSDNPIFLSWSHQDFGNDSFQ